MLYIGHILCAIRFDIENNAWVTGITHIWGHEWRDLPKIITSENHWQVASWLNQKSLFTVSNVFFIFYTLVYVLNTQYR